MKYYVSDTYPFEIRQCFIGYELPNAQYKQAEKFVAYYKKELKFSKNKKETNAKIKKHSNKSIKIKNEFPEYFI